MAGAGGLTVLCVVAARPNFVKVAPFVRALGEAGHRALLVHTGQHHDHAMSAVFLEELGMPAPRVNLGVRGGDHVEQVAATMSAFAPVLAELCPDCVAVAGDVNASLACALCAAQLGYPVVHIEAGLRAFDDAMPEERNRRLIDQLSQLLLAPSADAAAHLRHEGLAMRRIAVVGNLMIDTLARELPAARTEAAATRARLGVAQGDYAVVTLHRPQNVATDAALAPLVETVAALAETLPVIWPQHPRLGGRVAALCAGRHVILVPPQPYRASLGLLAGARLVLTDSGGIQEETTYLDVPCLTLRPSTERPMTVARGSNRVVGTRPEAVLAAAHAALGAARHRQVRPALWDGAAAPRAVLALEAAAAAGFA